MDRTARYTALVEARKSCTRCAGLANPSRVEGGRFDTAHIGPWTAWLGDLNAKVMVIGQEWGDQHAFLSQRGVDLPSSATNAMLRELLESIGIRVPPAGAPSHDSGVFLTNAALCLKDEGCQGPVRPEWFRECGVHFLRAQVELVMPRVVISLGQQAYIGLLASYGLLPAARFLDAVEGPGVVLPGGPHLFAVYHCGRRILNTHRKREQQFQDWRRIGVTLQQGGATPAAG